MYHEINLDKLKEECGVLGIYTDSDENTSRLLYYGLYALQHRGQESAGIAVNNGLKSNYHKGMGLVPDVFDEDILKRLLGHIGIGHVRYSTSGESYVENAQPLVARYRGGSISLAHNGNLTNAKIIKERLEDDGVIFQTSIDSEVIVNLIARYSGDGMIDAIERTMDLIKGAYSLVVMTEEELIGVRDPLGLRPLCLGKMGDSYVLASESCAFDVMGATLVRDIEPGEIVTINKEGIQSTFYKNNGTRASCIFEYIYFARPDSVIDGVSVYEARKNAGRILAKEHPVEADLVVAVPDSSVPVAIGYAEASGIPFGEGLIKNRYVGRTFIQPTQSMRELAVRLKLNPLKDNLQGKKIVMIDDSIVRGTTSRRLVERLKSAGAKEVHVRISSPPVAFGCYFGIDTPDRNQLIGAVKTVEQIRKTIGADSLGYISTDGLVKSTGLSKEHFCLACFNGVYPLEVPEVGDKKVFERLSGGE
ncbi:amidophosphoribosyltransferase [Clostridium formicaceticum]|uniref:Amidophosphoribosyltransferase n=1 Tax=Clostridium formicaceticum TaxID=1497 RepID=A0AAC9RKS4_9CLOT|nr:amidophosphoribosyltransferase [Clostridium formicaceticum]AOY75765.1 amidophosphoribosyltransferase [Clostridium formicaceticum]ARE86090.1 Amidophosphoribosyltransferase precursor [Clostridium formicaceticum]